LAIRFSKIFKGTNNFWHRNRLRNKKLHYYKLEARTPSRSVLGILYSIAVSANLVTIQAKPIHRIIPYINTLNTLVTTYIEFAKLYLVW